MRVTPEILKDYFAEHLGEVSLTGNTKQRFRDVKLYADGDETDTEYIYLMTPAQLEKIPHKAANAILTAKSKMTAGNGYCLIIAPGEPERVLNLVRECFRFYTESFEVLYEAIARGETIEAVLEKAFPLMKNPFFIDDSSYRTLARLKDYPTKDFRDNEYIFMQQSGHHSADYIYAMLNSNVAVESSAISPRPIVHRFEFLAHRTLYSTIKVDGEIVGFFSCVEIETTFTPGLMDVFEALTELWSVALWGGRQACRRGRRASTTTSSSASSTAASSTRSSRRRRLRRWASSRATTSSSIR